MTRRPALLWPGAGAAFLALELYCISRDDASTLSSVVRRAVASHPLGPVVFTAALIAGPAIFRTHILRPLAAAAAAVQEATGD